MQDLGQGFGFRHLVTDDFRKRHSTLKALISSLRKQSSQEVLAPGGVMGIAWERQCPAHRQWRGTKAASSDEPLQASNYWVPHYCYGEGRGQGLKGMSWNPGAFTYLMQGNVSVPQFPGL